jgi:hypothetical protein
LAIYLGPVKHLREERSVADKSRKNYFATFKARVLSSETATKKIHRVELELPISEEQYYEYNQLLDNEEANHPDSYLRINAPLDIEVVRLPE